MRATHDYLGNFIPDMLYQPGVMIQTTFQGKYYAL